MKTLGTFWLGGCSGCHMSFLDLDEQLVALNQRARVVASPFMDTRALPEHMDIALVEGAVSMDEHLVQLQRIRERSRILIAFGDCAVNGNVTAMRNCSNHKTSLLERFSTTPVAQQRSDHLPQVLERVVPLHTVVPVEYHLPGCPPDADLIWRVLDDLLDGRNPTFELEHRAND